MQMTKPHLLRTDPQGFCGVCNCNRARGSYVARLWVNSQQELDCLRVSPTWLPARYLLLSKYWRLDVFRHLVPRPCGTFVPPELAALRFANIPSHMGIRVRCL